MIGIFEDGCVHYDGHCVIPLEGEAEEKIAYGMCPTVNKGIREALQGDYTMAIIMDTSIFEYPNQAYMVMMSDKDVVGEQVRDPEKIVEYKRDRANFFLWENFVIYTRRLPREREARKNVRIVYLPREPAQLKGISCIEKSSFGTLSMEGDTLVKELLDFTSSDPVMGTCLIGLNLRK